jgi:hypothetical protein
MRKMAKTEREARENLAVTTDMNPKIGKESDVRVRSSS